MKSAIKAGLGRVAVSLACAVPGTRRMLKPLALRCTQGRFGPQVVEIPIRGEHSWRLTHVDESYLAFQLFWRGIDFYEPITRALFQELIQPKDTFLDLGAHIGFFSLNAGLSRKPAQIIAFEPNPKNFRILKENLLANGLTEVVCEPLAISDETNTAKLYLTPSDMSASLMEGFQSEDTDQIGEIQVRTTSLDEYLQDRALCGRLVVKVDIEGHEPAFFRGAEQTIAARKPDIILEVLYDQDPSTIAHLKSLGYHFYPVTDEGFVELDAPRLIKRRPLLFLNHLLSVRPKTEIRELFHRVRERTSHIDLLKTSKHFPPAEWPQLWAAEEEMALNRTEFQRKADRGP